MRWLPDKVPDRSKIKYNAIFYFQETSNKSQDNTESEDEDYEVRFLFVLNSLILLKAFY